MKGILSGTSTTIVSLIPLLIVPWLCNILIWVTCLCSHEPSKRLNNPECHRNRPQQPPKYFCNNHACDDDYRYLALSKGLFSTLFHFAISSQSIYLKINIFGSEENLCRIYNINTPCFFCFAELPITIFETSNFNSHNIRQWSLEAEQELFCFTPSYWEIFCFTHACTQSHRVPWIRNITNLDDLQAQRGFYKTLLASIKLITLS